MYKKNRAHSFKKLQLIEILVFCIVFTAFFILFNSAYKYAKPLDLEQLPLIRKTNLNFKIQPQNTAGLIIMHQNKTIYDNLKSQSKKELQKSKPLLEKNEDLLIILRSTYLKSKEVSKHTENPFFMITEDSAEQFVISFGTTSNQEAAETKLQRLASTYSELATSKFKIVQTDKEQYKIETLTPMYEKVAITICKKIKLTGDECNVIRLPKN